MGVIGRCGRHHRIGTDGAARAWPGEIVGAAGRGRHWITLERSTRVATASVMLCCGALPPSN